MRLDLLKLIRCPYCGSDFDLGEVYQKRGEELLNGWVKCECSQFALVEGILNLKLDPLNKYLVHLLKKGRIKEAIGTSLDSQAERMCQIAQPLNSGGLWERGIAKRLLSLIKLRARRHYSKYTDEKPFYHLLGGNPSQIYLKHRFSSETLWSLYPFIPVLAEKQPRVLDLSCGTGHSSFLISTYVKPGQLVCADHAFNYLYLAKKYFAQDAQFVCLNADYPLPFKDGMFTSVLMLDAFHYIKSRSSLAKEMERIVSPDGVLLLLHLHNSLGHNVAPGYALSPPGWLKLFRQLPVRALPEARIVEDFILNDKLDLDREYAAAELNTSNAISLLGTRDRLLLKTYPKVSRYFVGGKNNLVINPIYSIEPGSEKVILRRKFPSQSFRRENPLAEKYLPEEYTIRGRLAQAVRKRTFALPDDIPGEDLLQIEDMMKRFILVNVPEKYW